MSNSNEKFKRCDCCEWFIYGGYGADSGGYYYCSHPVSSKYWIERSPINGEKRYEKTCIGGGYEILNKDGKCKYYSPENTGTQRKNFESFMGPDPEDTWKFWKWKEIKKMKDRKEKEITGLYLQGSEGWWESLIEK